MIADAVIGGVLVPGLLVAAVLAMALTFAALKLLAASGLRRLFAGRALVEVALFVLIFALLAQSLPTNGIFS